MARQHPLTERLRRPNMSASSLRTWLIAVGVPVLAVGIHRCRVLARRSELSWRPPRPLTMTRPLAARASGKGTPIVLLHGLGASGAYWGSSFDELAVGHRLVVPDLLGFGSSPRPVTGYGPEEHVSAVASCLDAAGVHLPAVVVAHSAGGIIALRLAALHPERVRAVIVLGPPLYRDAEHARLHIRDMGLTARLFASNGSLSALACRWSCNHRTLAAMVAELTRPDLPSVIARDGVQHTWASYSETLRTVVLDSGNAAHLAEVRVPVHLVAGISDRVCDHTHLRSLAQANPNVHYLAWRGGHHLPLTDPLRVLDLILATAN